MDTVKYHFFYQKGSIFSQFYLCKFRGHYPTLDTKEAEIDHNFKSTEHYMHYYKAILFRDFDIAAQILKAETPLEAKKLGRKVKNFSQAEWDEYKFDIVYHANLLKFSQNIELKKIMMQTSGKFVEASPRDKIWGIGMGISNPDIHDKSKWKGKNLLGKALNMVKKVFLLPN